MSGRTSFLGNLRRRRASLGRIALAWFVFAAASAGAAPCVAMTAPPATAQQVTAPPSALPGHHEHRHTAAVAQPHSASSEPADAAHGQPTPCSHCPLAHAMSGDEASTTASHAFCSATDDVSDGGKPNTAPPAFKIAWVVPIIELLPTSPRPSPRSDRQRLREAVAAPIPLNLRHCVFLI